MNSLYVIKVMINDRIGHASSLPLSPIMLIVEPKTINKQHVSFWCQILDLQLTLYHLNIGVQLRQISELAHLP